MERVSSVGAVPKTSDRIHDGELRPFVPGDKGRDAVLGHHAQGGAFVGLQPAVPRQ